MLNYIFTEGISINYVKPGGKWRLEFCDKLLHKVEVQKPCKESLTQFYSVISSFFFYKKGKGAGYCRYCYMIIWGDPLDVLKSGGRGESMNDK